MEDGGAGDLVQVYWFLLDGLLQQLCLLELLGLRRPCVVAAQGTHGIRLLMWERRWGPIQVPLRGGCSVGQVFPDHLVGC